MAAQLRAVVPSSSSSFPPSFASPATHAQRVSASRGSSCSSVSVHRSRGKHLHTAFAYSSSFTPTSTVVTESKEASELSELGGGGGGSWNGNGGGGGGDGWGDGHYAGNEDNDDSLGRKGFFSALLKGWNDRVKADSQFPFKVLMEQIVGVGASVIGDMACRPNFGLNELDFVFSTLVVGSILNFALMYMLAPTSVAASTSSMLPSIFSSCPSGHMFEQGAYSVLDRFGTFVYKGTVFAAVGFGAGLFGTFLSNCLIGLRKQMDPSFEPQNKAPPTLLNASTWAIHMGLSSNLRYQLINGLEFAMANVLPPPAFKASVFCIRAFNNVLGGFSFVALARLTGSQKKSDATDASALADRGLEVSVKKAEEPAKLVEASATHEAELVADGARAKGEDAAETGGSTKQRDDGEEQS